MAESVFLPTSVKPVNYKLRLEPDLNASTFAGSVDIEIVRPPSENCLI